MEKLPPLAKVFEAWSALADGRVALDAEKRRMICNACRTRSYNSA